MFSCGRLCLCAGDGPIIAGAGREALKNNPEILAAQKRYEAARQRPSRESSLPDPMLSLGWTSNGNPLPGAGLGVDPTSNIGVSVSQELPAPGKLRLRGEIAAKEAEADFQQYLAVKLSVIARLKLAYHQLHHAYEATEIMRREQKLLGNFMRNRRIALLGGQGRAAGYLPGARPVRHHGDPDRCAWSRISRCSRPIINSLLNRPQDTPVAHAGRDAGRRAPVTLDELLAHARTDAPAVMRDQKMVERSELALNLARKEYAPGLRRSRAATSTRAACRPCTRSAWTSRFRPTSGASSGPRSPSRPTASSEARHTYEAGKAEPGGAHPRRVRQRADRAQADGPVFEIGDRRRHRWRSNRRWPSYETGALDFLSVLTNFMTVVDYELNYHEEMVRFHLALARLEEMTGLEIDPAR